MKRYKAIKCGKRGSKNGSIIVEAAIFLPVFITAVLTIGLLIRQVGIEETVVHSMVNQGRLASITAVSGQLTDGSGEASDVSQGLTGLGSRQLFTAGLKTQLKKELRLDEEASELSAFRFLYREGERDQLIRAAVTYQIRVPLPGAARERMNGGKEILLRAFTGKETKGEQCSAEKMETEEESHIVCVFPRAGERYHGENCTTITSLPVKRILTPDVRRRYAACSLCDAAALGTGSMVYCFPRWGEAYHRKTCKSVDKYIVRMEREEAEKQGYTPCMKCGER